MTTGRKRLKANRNGDGMEQLGLRDRQRLRRHRTILFSAAELFGQRGFAETTMEDIAAKAEVTPPTIYNYFRSKSDILLGLLEVDKELMDEALDAVIAAPQGDAVEVICEFIRIDLEGGYDIREKAVWRLISAAALEASDDRRGDYLRAQSVFSRKLERLVTRLQKDGKLVRGGDPTVIARIINSITRDSFRIYINSELMSVAGLNNLVREQIEMLWRGLRVG